MNFNLNDISVRDLSSGYIDSAENGCRAFSGNLNVRPPFQREFVYSPSQRDDVIHSVRHSFPLNVMYWIRNSEGTFELLDGQQRTVSICQYIHGDYSIGHLYFQNLTDTEKNQILDYRLHIYICEGTDKEILDWFRIINISGEKLTDQELRNAVYTGPWLTDAKKYFSKPNCAAYQMAEKYMTGSAIRQNYLETAIGWIAARDGLAVDDYMALHQFDANANELWLYFQSVLSWVKVLFPEENYRKEMKGIDWGLLYNDYHDGKYDASSLEETVLSLMEDDDVTSKSGIYYYVFDGLEKHLNIRKFSKSMARSAYERQRGICPKCKKHFEIDKMQADHIVPWSRGGKTSAENCQMLCSACNRMKSDL